MSIPSGDIITEQRTFFPKPKESGLQQCCCFLLCFCRALSFLVSPGFLEKHKMAVGKNSSHITFQSAHLGRNVE